MPFKEKWDIKIVETVKPLKKKGKGLWWGIAIVIAIIIIASM